MTRAHDPVFFVFANTDRVSELRNASANIIHLPTIYSDAEKSRFLYAMR